MNDQDLIQSIALHTNKKLGEDYGFICGTHHPLMEKQNIGYMSSNRKLGFTVWKKENNITSEIQIVPKDYSDSLNQIIDFLKN